LDPLTSPGPASDNGNASNPEAGDHVAGGGGEVGTNEMPAGGRARPGRIAVIYDGECSMCRVSAEAVRVFDNSDAIDLIDLHNDDARAQFPTLKIDALMEELHVVDDRGHVSRGARAVNEVLRQQHGLRGWLAYLWYVPGYAWIADRQYKRIARSRYGLNRDGHPNQPRSARDS
jgi:predicted DCC family thiol-disulfide oxidoreductase YuxK